MNARLIPAPYRGGEIRIYIDLLAILSIGGRKWLGEKGARIWVEA